MHFFSRCCLHGSFIHTKTYFKQLTIYNWCEVGNVMMRDMECRNLIIKNSMNVFGKIMQYGILINIIFTQKDILGCRLSAKYIWDYCWVSQETPWKLPMPWSKLREQDKKPKHSKEYSELLRFYAKAHRVQEKLSKQPTKEAFYVFFVWFLNLHEDVNQSVF